MKRKQPKIVQENQNFIAKEAIAMGRNHLLDKKAINQN